MSKFYFKDIEIPIKITYKQAMFDFKDQGLDLLNIFGDDDNQGNAIQTIMMNDNIMVPIWYSYVSKHCAGTLENAVEELSPEDMNKFREAFWEAVVNFMPSLMRPALIAFMKKMKSEMQSPERKLNDLFSKSLEEQE